MTVSLLKGQITPAANTVTVLATVPTGRVVNGPIVTVHNHDSVSHVFSILVAQAALATTDKQYIRTDYPIAAGGVVDVLIPHTLLASDVIRVKTDANALVNFFVQNPATSK